MITIKKKAGPALRRVLGVDLSSSATGVVVLKEGSTMPDLAVEIAPEKGLKGLKAKSSMVDAVMKHLIAVSPHMIVVEGYSLNLKNASSVVPLIEVGTIFRLRLMALGYSWFDPRAGELKKFATGKGNSPKDVVMMHVLKRFGFTSETNNIADAYVAAAMGLARLGSLPKCTKEMTVIAESMEPLTL